jgi:uncharacterized protein (PEP-CTERM system associated)
MSSLRTMKQEFRGTVFTPFEGPVGVRRVSGVALLMLLGITSSAAAQTPWQFSAGTDASVSYTDNALLEMVDPDEDFIVSADLSVGAQAQSSRSSVQFSYSYGYDAYAETDELDGMRQQLLSINQFSIVPGSVILNVRAAIQERDGIQNLRRPATIRTINSRRTTVYSGLINPHVQTTLGNRAAASYGARYQLTAYKDPDVGSSPVPNDRQTWSTYYNVQGLDQGSAITWQFYGDMSINDNDFENHSVAALLGSRLGQQTQVFVRGGYDRTKGRANNLDIDDPFWRFGFQSQPTKDISLRFEAGERYGGPSYDAEVRYQISKFALLTASFIQTLQTGQRRLANNLGAIQLDPNGVPIIAPSIDNNLTGAAPVSETARISLSGARGRLSYNVSAFNMLRKYDQFVAPGQLAEDEIRGATVSVSRDYGRRTSLDFLATVQDNDSLNPLSSIDFKQASLTARYLVTNTASLSLQYAYSRREDGLGVSVAENVILLSFSKSW